jgi:WD40 repeat protein
LHRFDEHSLDVFAVLFSHDGRRLYTGSRDQSILVWDVATRSLVQRLADHGHFVTSLALNTRGSRLAAGSWYGEIFLFDVESLDSIASFRAHESAIRSVAFSPDDRWIASASYDATVRLFDSAARAEAENRSELAEHAYRAAHERLKAEQTAEGAQITDLPDTDPWLRKALLSTLLPPKPSERH